MATKNPSGDMGFEEVFRGPGGLGERVPPPPRPDLFLCLALVLADSPCPALPAFARSRAGQLSAPASRMTLEPMHLKPGAGNGFEPRT